jgi:hypothetical protein
MTLSGDAASARHSRESGNPVSSPFSPQPLPGWKRAVLKVGSSLLAGDGGLDDAHARGLAGFIAAARAQGREVVLVSSGAVAAGRGRIAAGAGIARDGIVRRQALAALGQAGLKTKVVRVRPDALPGLPKVDNGAVAQTDPKAGIDVPRGSTVTVVVVQDNAD